jgi:cyclic pyranopterin phosphate synthase
MSDTLTHLDADGRARMVDVGHKETTHRVCVARCEVHMLPETLARIAEGRVEKGDVLATARIAGIQAAKRASDWIPLAHPLPIDSVSVELTSLAGGGVLRPSSHRHAPRAVLQIEATVEAHWRTGVEMEALVAVSAAGLTVYDMCKAVDRGMSVESVRLISKRGGKSGVWQRSGEST